MKKKKILPYLFILLGTVLLVLVLRLILKQLPTGAGTVFHESEESTTVTGETLTSETTALESVTPAVAGNDSSSASADTLDTADTSDTITADTAESEADYIHWVDFDVTAKALNEAYKYDVDTHDQEIHLSWIDLLAYLGARYGGDFSKYKTKDLNTVADSIINGETTMEELTADMKYFLYYQEAYGAVLGGMVGDYEIQVADPNDETQVVWETRYGLKAYSPIGRGYDYQDYDDFGSSRSYGYKRVHLGHDMMGQVGTPIIAIESGYVEAIGWNQYGGWRLGIRSLDGKRYYYYAHLRKNFPYNKSLEVGSVVTAGDVIGYMGRTGYSTTENTNNIEVSHLHIGLELIFDESQKDSTNEIWINCYPLMDFLYKNRSATVKDQETKEYSRIYQMKDPAVAEFLEQQK